MFKSVEFWRSDDISSTSLLSYEAISYRQTRCLVVLNLHRRALGRAGPVTFVATKVTKKACSREASLRTTWPHSHRRDLHPAKRTEPRAAIILPRFARNASASAKTCYAPAAAPPSIVLLVFTRSWSAAKNHIFYLVMGSSSKHGGQGLCARPFDGLRVTGLLWLIYFSVRVI